MSRRPASTFRPEAARAFDSFCSTRSRRSLACARSPAAVASLDRSRPRRGKLIGPSDQIPVRPHGHKRSAVAAPAPLSGGACRPPELSPGRRSLASSRSPRCRPASKSWRACWACSWSSATRVRCASRRSARKWSRARASCSPPRRISWTLAKGAAEPLAGLLGLGVIPTIAPFLLPALLPQLRRRYPRLRLHLREDLTERLLERLRGGQLDMARDRAAV